MHRAGQSRRWWALLAAHFRATIATSFAAVRRSEALLEASWARNTVPPAARGLKPARGAPRAAAAGPSVRRLPLLRRSRERLPAPPRHRPAVARRQPPRA